MEQSSETSAINTLRRMVFNSRRLLAYEDGSVPKRRLLNTLLRMVFNSRRLLTYDDGTVF
jgi:hypothetical protein